MPDSVRFIVSIDTEEDNWYRSRQKVTVANIAELRRQARFFDRLGIRPTYFTTYQVARDARAADVIRDVSGGAEIGAHLHPWNTPPLTEAFTPRNSMLKNLPAALQELKLRALTDTLEQAFGTRPRGFRAGRYGLGQGTVGVLLRCGYTVDSSVTPFVTWKAFDDGPSFDGAPVDIYRLAPDRDVTLPVENGALTEVPLSCGFSRGPFAMWGRVRRALDTAVLRRLRLVGLAARTGLCKRIILSPEMASDTDMLTLSRRLLERGVGHLHLSWHSPSLQPGLSPFTRTTADVDRLYATVEAYVEQLSKLTPLTFATVSEAAAVEAAAC
ncbi:MAG TPA: hypothetical protein VFO67_18940 [Gemmatimonadales bacterium]|nr:hypothetical protein [Gemmatimonadales bacterium]